MFATFQRSFVVCVLVEKQIRIAHRDLGRSAVIRFLVVSSPHTPVVCGLWGGCGRFSPSSRQIA